jgi:hypothetical protein
MYPLRRRLVRRLFKTFGMRRWSHWEEGWPHLALDRPVGERPGAVRWKGRDVAPLLSARAFAERVGGEVVIIGSGPSLRGQDPGRLPAGVAVLLNGALSLAPRLAPLATAIEDEQFVWAQGEMVRAHLGRGGLLLLSAAAMRAILSLDARLLDGRDVVLSESLLRPWRGARRRDAEIARLPEVVARDGAALSLDPDRGLVPCGTVAFAALQFALAAAPGRVGLAGIDLSNAREPRFYENRPGEPSNLPRRQRTILAHMALARDVAAERGIALECYSPVSALLELGLPYVPRLEGSPPQTPNVSRM